MPSEKDFNLLKFYINDLIPDLINLGSFLGNIDFPKDFYVQVLPGLLGNHSHLDPNTDQEKSFLIFGEVASLESGTKLSATGNHFKGKPGDPVGVLFCIDTHKC